jgi:hypothetical protein
MYCKGLKAYLKSIKEMRYIAFHKTMNLSIEKDEEKRKLGTEFFSPHFISLEGVGLGWGGWSRD